MMSRIGRTTFQTRSLRAENADRNADHGTEDDRRRDQRQGRHRLGPDAEHGDHDQRDDTEGRDARTSAAPGDEADQDQHCRERDRVQHPVVEAEQALDRPFDRLEERAQVQRQPAHPLLDPLVDRKDRKIVGLDHGSRS